MPPYDGAVARGRRGLKGSCKAGCEPFRLGGDRLGRHVFAEGLSAHGTREFWKPGEALHDVSSAPVIRAARISNAGVTMSVLQERTRRT
jgi:hypothetical protein